jgi:helix-turn-helix protein
VDQPTRLPELEKAISDTIDNLIQQQAKFEEESQMLVALISSLRSQTSSVLVGDKETPQTPW